MPKLAAPFALALALLAAPAPTQPTGVKLTATLAGTANTDPDGTGTFSARVNPGQRKLCYDLTVSGIALPTAGAHIHRTSDGSIAVPLNNPANGSSTGCVGIASRALARAMIQNPASFYVNVHNGSFPGGAIRGTLMK